MDVFKAIQARKEIPKYFNSSCSADSNDTVRLENVLK